MERLEGLVECAHHVALDREEDRRDVALARPGRRLADHQKARRVVGAVLDALVDDAQPVELRRDGARDRGDLVVAPGELRRLRRRVRGLLRHVGQVQLEPAAALSQRLRVRVDRLDRAELARLRQQVVVDRNVDLGRDRERRLDEQVERVADHAFVGVLDRHHAELGLAGLDLREDRVGGRRGSQVRHLSELLDRGLVCVGRGRTEICDADAALQRDRRGDDLAEDLADRRGRERTGVRALEPLEDLELARRHERGRAAGGLQAADIGVQRGAAVQQREDLRIDRVDLFAQRCQRLLVLVRVAHRKPSRGARLGRARLYPSRRAARSPSPILRRWRQRARS